MFPGILRNMSKKKYTREQFEQAVSENFSICATMKSLGQTYNGQAYRSFYSSASEWEVDYSHFTGQACRKGKRFPPRKSIEEYLVLGQKGGNYTASHALKKRLIQSGIKTHQCESCKRKNWMGQPIPIELDHINGCSWDNRIENLRILCPNCHSQTPTHAGKNIGGVSQPAEESDSKPDQ